MAAETCIGIDVGGSKIAAGLVAGDGSVIRRAQVSTPASAGGAAVLQSMINISGELLAGESVAAVGVGAAGVIRDGRVFAATDLLTDWVGTDLVAGLGVALASGDGAMRVAAVNDVHAHGAGEVWRGAGAGRDPVLLIAVGTGLGGVLLEQSRPLVGAHGAAGHVGHISSAAAAGLPCSCGAVGHLEAIASGYGMVQLYRTLGGDTAIENAEQLIARTDQDGCAAEAVRRSARALGHAIGDMINFVDPDLVIISGGVSGAGPEWWRQVRTAAAETVLPLLSEVEIVPATLGDDAGIVGAARLAFDLARIPS